MDEDEPISRHEQGISPVAVALGQEDPLGSAVRDGGERRDRMRPVRDAGRRDERDRRASRKELEHVAIGTGGGATPQEPSEIGCGERKDPVALGLRPPQRLQLLELLRVRRRDVVTLPGIARQVVELPVVRVELVQDLIREGCPERVAAFMTLLETWTRVRTHRLPTVVIDRPVAEHLEVLRPVPIGRGGIDERLREADALDR